MPPSPVDEVVEIHQKLASDRAAKDLELWHQWNASGRTAEGLHPLMQRYSPLLQRKLKEWRAPAVSAPAFMAELQKHFIMAAHDFDPKFNVGFNTYLQTRLPKAMRFNNRYQNVGYIPEAQAAHIGKIQSAQDELTEQLGRTPTHEEIGARLKLRPQQVSNVLGALRKDIPSSSFETDPAAYSSGREEDVIRLIARRPEDYFEPDEVKVFKHIYGIGVPKLTSTKALAQAIGSSESRVSRLKSSIAHKVQSHL